MYSKEWQGIQFDEFASLSSKRLADGQFYGKFYKAFFDRYRSYDDIDQAWRDQEKLVADFLFRLILNGKSRGRIVSVGCGLGYIEHVLIRSGINPAYFDVFEIVETPLRWLRKELPGNNIHVGFIPECLPGNRRYSLIYLASVDYIMDQNELIALLGDLRSRLAPGGRCIVVTASYDGVYGLARIKRTAKEVVKHLLDATGLRPLGQFWGYARNRGEFQFAMNAAGYMDVQDGFIKSSKEAIYWISGDMF
jgi:SAM-dependent methyltransferase